MMSAKEYTNAWKIVNKIYDETISENNPEVTMKEIISELGLENTIEVFAAITAIKDYFRDSRISDRNKSIMCDVSILPECEEWNSKNPLMSVDIDHIHTTHINNLLNVLVMEME